MRVLCIAATPTAEQARQLGTAYLGPKQVFGTAGQEYLVYGLTVSQGIVWIEISPDHRFLISAPLFLFEVKDPRVSALWELRAESHGLVRIWPAAFFEEFFHEDLAADEPGTRDIFERLTAALEKDRHAIGLA